MAMVLPQVGHWYRRPNGSIFEVVAFDRDDGTVEIQHFDATIEEVDFENWRELGLIEVDAPEDWTGSVDVDIEDVAQLDDDSLPYGWHDPLAFLDRAD